MIRNYLHMALRTFWKERGYSLINLFGLSVGLSAVLFILLFIKEESSYDRFHPNVEQKYRLTETFRNGEELTTTVLTPYKAAPLLAEISPAVQSYCRIDNTAGRVFLRRGEEQHEETALVFVDSNFFEFFGFPLLQGRPEEVLREPFTLVMAEDKAELYFGDADPVGQTVQVIPGYNGNPYEVTVTGVMAKMPANSHFHYDFLLSMGTGDKMNPGKIDSWGWTSQYSYIELAKGHFAEAADAALQALLAEHAPEWFQQWAHFGIQPVQDIHLHSRLKDEMEANGDISYLYIFSVIGLFILLVACINYLNLAGTGFKEHPNDSAGLIVVNEAAARLLGRRDPTGITFQTNGHGQPKVIGMVEDFHFESLYSQIRPMFFTNSDQSNLSTISILLSQNNIDASLAHLEQTWEQMNLRETFSFQFMDEAIDRQYRAERRFLSIFTVFAALAIFIACLGIFGLSAYAVTQRTKEIGVRKVLGASAGQIAVLLSSDFLRLVGWAFLLASPVAYLAMSNWLEQFAYQVNIHPALFLAAGITALGIAVLAISYNAWRAARSNPVEALRYE